MIRICKLVFVLIHTCLFTAINAPAAPLDKSDLTVCVLDVGQGLCIVVRTPGGRIMVVDCGTSGRENNRKVASIPIRYLSSLGADHIDLAVLTHPHDDHLSGYADLLRAKPARMVLDLGQPHPTADYRRFLKRVKQCHAKYIIARRGQLFTLEECVAVTVLSDPATLDLDLNDRSIVLRLAYKDVAFIFTGDAGAKTERDILRSYTNVQSQVLQIGHHGSETASTNDWLAAVKPVAAIISCGRYNDYGHPAQEILRKLQGLKVKVYRTDEDGAVLCRTDGHHIRTRAFRRKGLASRLQSFQEQNSRSAMRRIAVTEINHYGTSGYHKDSSGH